jgi:hypothetical protein
MIIRKEDKKIMKNYFNNSTEIFDSFDYYETTAFAYDLLVSNNEPIRNKQ